MSTTKQKHTLHLGIISLILVLLITAVSGCNFVQKIDYSVGLSEDGYYKDFQTKEEYAKVTEDIDLSMDKVINWAIFEHYGYQDEKTFWDEYVQSYLDNAGFSTRKTVQKDDIVNASITFTFNDKTEGFTDDYVLLAGLEGDAIADAVIGHNVGDEFDVEYRWPEDDPEYPAKDSVATVTITALSMADIASEEHITLIKDDLTQFFGQNIESFDDIKEALKPFLAESVAASYVTDVMRTSDLKVPEEYTEYEFQRLNLRIRQLGFTYKTYLDEIKKTDADVRLECEALARENIVSMQFAKDHDITVTEDDMKARFGDEYESYIEVQGRPYLTLNMLRSKVCDSIVYENEEYREIRDSGKAVEESQEGAE